MKVLIAITLMNLALFMTAVAVHHLELSDEVAGITVQSQAKC